MRGSCTTTRPEPLAANASRWTRAGSCCANNGSRAAARTRGQRARARHPRARARAAHLGRAASARAAAAAQRGSSSRATVPLAGDRARCRPGLSQRAMMTATSITQTTMPMNVLSRLTPLNYPGQRTRTCYALAKESGLDAYKRTTLVKNKQTHSAFGACMVSAAPMLTPSIWLGREGVQNLAHPSQH